MVGIQSYFLFLRSSLLYAVFVQYCACILILRALVLENASLKGVMLRLERAVKSGPEELGLRNILTQPHAWSSLEQQLQSIDVSVEPVESLILHSTTSVSKTMFFTHMIRVDLE
jgi:hypothetical protein